jgi:thymidylate kinase
MIVSFSGIDGAGKSTQIGALQDWLAKSGAKVKLYTFWDDVVAFPQFREFMSHAAFKGDKGIGTPEKPLHRRDKNVKSWPVSASRFGLYFADAVKLCRVVRSIQKNDADVVIFDRYIYDELANLPLNRWLSRAFIRFLLKLVPKPDIAYLIDADPVAARTRKPEYPLDFLQSNREAYLTLSRLTGAITVIEPLPVEAAEIKVKEAFLQKLPVPEDGLSQLPALP